MIELKNLTCSYDSKLILDDINIKITNHLSILGANGSGKSTLAKAICNLIDFDGLVEVESTSIKEFSLLDKAKTISYIPAKLEVYDMFITVEEFVLLGRFAYKKSFFEYSAKDKNITKETFEFLKIEHLKEHTVSSLSSGEQQLVLVAQALAQQSKIIIFDEPTANLDPHNSKVIAEHIKGLKDYHQVILITHDLNLASYVESPVLFIKDAEAKLYEDGFFNNSTLEELYGVEFESLAVKYD
ncbi:ABC transporter ATP-binding protein [Candidatus Sulfurimonas marisnigri]|uniref:ABC transporter ATP-binding protein n=1 Tax=Candidatus Sulfurimonas marisnigri TaxID=2740405 RepID=A0A7S7M0E6_9BACT|nr:ABC transporter ATP-binding protein [Candidatus Sulfurimonas marisnigri]QOY54751.1 ABC transporter ATP-binding protein [Candidatus Sulfurimonas marisnigri]